MLLTHSSPGFNSLNMLSVSQEEEANTDVDDVFPPHVDTSNIIIHPESPTSKKQSLKTFNDINSLLQASRKREVKLCIRDNAWPLNSGIRGQLWPALCQQHAHGKSIFTKAEDGFYWGMVTTVFGTVGESNHLFIFNYFIVYVAIIFYSFHFFYRVTGKVYNATTLCR